MLYQPFRDFEGVDDQQLADNLRRAEAKFALMQRLGIDTILVCSNVGYGDRSTMINSSPVSSAGSVILLRVTACGSRTRRWPGAGS